MRRAAVSKATRATALLEKSGVAFTVHSYDYDLDADKIGMQGAEALGEAPARVLKSLMALVDGKPVCVIVPSDREVSMKRLAAALGGSPFGQMRALPTAIEEQAMAENSRLHQRWPARLATAPPPARCRDIAQSDCRAAGGVSRASAALFTPAAAASDSAGPPGRA